MQSCIRRGPTRMVPPVSDPKHGRTKSCILMGSSLRNPELPLFSHLVISLTASGHSLGDSLHQLEQISRTARCRTSVWRSSDGGMDIISMKSYTRFLRGRDLPLRRSAKPEAPPSTTPTSTSNSCWTEVSLERSLHDASNERCPAGTCASAGWHRP